MTKTNIIIVAVIVCLLVAIGVYYYTKPKKWDGRDEVLV